MMRTVQSVLRGVNSYEDIVIRKNKEEERYLEILKEDAEMERAYEADKRSSRQAQQ